MGCLSFRVKVFFILRFDHVEKRTGCSCGKSESLQILSVSVVSRKEPEVLGENRNFHGFFFRVTGVTMFFGQNTRNVTCGTSKRGVFFLPWSLRQVFFNLLNRPQTQFDLLTMYR
jgi:hypothetical protein